MNIERTISLKATALYIVSGVIVLFISVYIYRLRSEIINQRAELDVQQSNFEVTNELISLVNEAQLAGSIFLANGDTLSQQQMNFKSHQIDSLIRQLTIRSYPGIKELSKINTLLTDQIRNIYSLSSLLAIENPLSGVQRRINEYTPSVREDISIISVREDTIIQPTGKKKFFRRLRDVFAPDNDSTVLVTKQRIDTLKIKQQDSLTILTEVDTISRKASREYTHNIRQIEQQVGNLLMADRTIASRISELLTQLHQQTLHSVMKAIDQNEKSVNRNYLISVIGGFIALVLMLIFVLLIIYDVNKGKKARTQLREVLDSRHRLLLSVSHDIKSPLSSLLAYLELKSREGDDTRSMQHAAQHILAMLENLLEYSSLEQGTLQLNNSKVDIHEMGCELTEMFEPLAQAKQLSLHHQSDSVHIIIDAMKTRQIIINLISNAIKYTPRGEVKLQLSYDNEYLNISVNDTGAGIPNDKLDEIFLPFTRVESNNTLAHGSGFGMYVVKGLSELMKGTISIESTVGEGTKVKVRLPAQLAINKDVVVNSKRIKVVEDDPLMHEMACDMLRNLGHEVVEAGYEIVLTDMEMGDISGLDILTGERNIPVVLMTGSSDLNREKALQLGFADFIAKPFTLKELKNVFGKAIPLDEDSFFINDDEVMQLFRTSTIENQQLLQQALQDKDFASAQAICHKMLPMMAQLGYPTEALAKMDKSRGKEYEGWEKDVSVILAIRV